MDDTALNSVSIRVPTPDGTLFVNIMEDDTGKPVGMLIHIGKTGASVMAWAEGMARACTMAMQRGAGINDLISEFSSITTDRITMLQEGSVVRSGPEGVAVALMKYRREKFKELKETLGVRDDNERPRIGA